MNNKNYLDELNIYLDELMDGLNPVDMPDYILYMQVGCDTTTWQLKGTSEWNSYVVTKLKVSSFFELSFSADFLLFKVLERMGITDKEIAQIERTMSTKIREETSKITEEARQSILEKIGAV